MFYQTLLRATLESMAIFSRGLKLDAKRLPRHFAPHNDAYSF